MDYAPKSPPGGDIFQSGTVIASPALEKKIRHNCKNELQFFGVFYKFENKCPSVPPFRVS
jgi:hypothetical protein